MWLLNLVQQHVTSNIELSVKTVSLESNCINECIYLEEKMKDTCVIKYLTSITAPLLGHGKIWV